MVILHCLTIERHPFGIFFQMSAICFWMLVHNYATWLNVICTDLKCCKKYNFIRALVPCVPCLQSYKLWSLNYHANVRFISRIYILCIWCPQQKRSSRTWCCWIIICWWVLSGMLSYWAYISNNSDIVLITHLFTNIEKLMLCFSRY